VRLIRHKNTSRYYAAKILKKHEVVKAKQIDHVQSESEILASISHPFIVCSPGLVRFIWRDLLKIPDIFILFFNMSRVENFLLI
jgi:serine/threonine protein kinase